MTRHSFLVFLLSGSLPLSPYLQDGVTCPGTSLRNAWNAGRVLLFPDATLKLPPALILSTLLPSDMGQTLRGKWQSEMQSTTPGYLVRKAAHQVLKSNKQISM